MWGRYVEDTRGLSVRDPRSGHHYDAQVCAGEKDMGWLEHYEEKWNWGFEGGEEQPALTPETMVKS